MRYLEVGQIVTTHGIKGELKVKIITDNLTRFDKGSKLFLGDNKEPIIIDSSRLHQNMMLITINGYKNINDVEKYVNKMIYCDTDLYDESDDDGYYYDDLIGCSVIVNEETVGIVKDIMDLPQGACLEIKMNNPIDSKNPIRLVPYVDEFINSVDIKNKIIIITPIEGLL